MVSDRVKLEFPHTDERGFALLWALVVIFVILVGGAIVLKVTFDAHLRAKNRALERRAEWLAKTGVTRFLIELNDPNTEPETLLDRAFRDSISENESITRTLYPWGGALLAVNTGKVGSVEFNLSRILGQQSDLPDSVLVRTRNKNYPLVLAGATSAPVEQSGALGLPVKVSSLGGKPTSGLYQGRGPTQTVVDKWAYHDTSVAELNPWLWKHELAQLRQQAQDGEVTHFGTQQFVGMDLSNQLSQAPLIIDGDLELIDCTIKSGAIPAYIFARGRITIRGDTYLQGRIKLWARDEIIIEDKAVIDGAALISDSALEIRGESICKGYVLAGYSVTIAEKVSLYQGSTVAVYLDNEQGRTMPVHGLRIKSRSNINAHIALYVEKTDSRMDIPRIKIDSNVTFTGVVTSNHYVENHSDVIAQFDIDAFWFRSQTTTYLNWIIDRRIMRRFENTEMNVIGGTHVYMQH